MEFIFHIDIPKSNGSNSTPVLPVDFPVQGKTYTAAINYVRQRASTQRTPDVLVSHLSEASCCQP